MAEAPRQPPDRQQEQRADLQPEQQPNQQLHQQPNQQPNQQPQRQAGELPEQQPALGSSAAGPGAAGSAGHGSAATAVLDEPSAGLRTPGSCRELFIVFTQLALQGFGGVLPVAHRTLVERQRWVSPEQFVGLLTTAQVLPGPNIINMSLMLGDRWFGWRGALAASAGLMAVPLLIVLALATLYQQWQHLPMVAGALRGMGAVAAGLVIGTAVKLMRTLRSSPLGVPACVALAAATFGAVGLARWPLVVAVLGIGGVGMALAARRIRQLDRAKGDPP